MPWRVFGCWCCQFSTTSNLVGFGWCSRLSLLEIRFYATLPNLETSFQTTFLFQEVYFISIIKSIWSVFLDAAMTVLILDQLTIFVVWLIVLSVFVFNIVSLFQRKSNEWTPCIICQRRFCRPMEFSSIFLTTLKVRISMMFVIWSCIRSAEKLVFLAAVNSDWRVVEVDLSRSWFVYWGV